MTRTVFFISDGTGISAETLGRSLLSQFAMIPFNYITIPNVNNLTKAKQAAKKIKAAHEAEGERPIIFATIIDEDIGEFLSRVPALFLNFFQTFINPLEKELGQKSTHMVGLLHSAKNYTHYMGRINAVNYALTNDDGAHLADYESADVILIGVSRCGKTPTCLYLALQFGIYAANYPLTTDDMAVAELPKSLEKYKNKLFGLTIDAMRLQKIRYERFPDRDYSTLKQCEKELKFAESLFKRKRIPYLDTTTLSIEEISAEIMTIADIKRRIY